MNPRVHVVIMTHPARHDRIARLRQACAPLCPVVVVDPDPTSFRSPLRTAKRAWAAIDDDSTHHLVLQDDVVPSPQFAGHLLAAVTQRPEHAIALYTDWISPQNGYLVRRAAALGSSWAPLSPMEWVPAQGFLLPTPLARKLAGYLAAIPDEVRDDDQMIAVFCRENGIGLVATVPSLVDNAGLPTLTTGHGGVHHAAVPARTGTPEPQHWVTDPRWDTALAGRCGYRDDDEFVVELRDSRCLLRFLRPRQAEPAGQEYRWYWHDWCALVGVDPVDVLAPLQRHLGRCLGTSTVDRLLVEVWAAGYLLGCDARDIDRQVAADVPRRTAEWLPAAVTSWIDSGLVASDRAALTVERHRALGNLAVSAVAAGRMQWHMPTCDPALAASQPTASQPTASQPTASQPGAATPAAAGCAAAPPVAVVAQQRRDYVSHR